MKLAAITHDRFDSGAYGNTPLRVRSGGAASGREEIAAKAAFGRMRVAMNRSSVL